MSIDTSPAVVAWMLEPNEKSHPAAHRKPPILTFDKPHKRSDWEVTGLFRESALTQAYAEGRVDQLEDDVAECDRLKALNAELVVALQRYVDLDLKEDQLFQRVGMPKRETNRHRTAVAVLAKAEAQQ
jgi:hypothetical protein